MVDGHADTRELVALVLGQDGIATAEAPNGALAVQRSREAPRQAVIVLNLRLPDCHGTAVLSTLRSDAVTAQIPVLVLTRSVTAADRQGAADAGTVAFLSKPIRPEDLVAAVRGVLARHGNP